MDPTRRQLKLLALHSSGMTCDELAEHMHISRKLVYYELTRLKRALGARNIYHAQVLALAAGLVEVDGREGCLFVPERDVVAA